MSKVMERLGLLSHGDATLNGRPAQISGIKERFATVRSLDGELSAQFSWQAVERIVCNKDGRFQT
jgi:hypothetical protein